MIGKLNLPAHLQPGSTPTILVANPVKSFATEPVTHAGQHVGKSQPAMSRALDALRGVFNDDLLVRASSGYVLTPEGQRLAELLPSALNMIRRMVTNDSFTAKEWRSKTTVAMPDHQTMILLPRLMQRAPHLEIVPQSLSKSVLRGLEQGDVDLAVGQLDGVPPGYLRRSLYTDQFVSLLRHDHPALARAWTIESFMALRHTAVSSNSNNQGSRIYDELPELQLPDHNPMRLSHVLTAAMVVATTDLALMVPRRAANLISAMLPLTAVDPPLDLKPYEVMLIWHERCHHDPKHKWLRGQFAAAVAPGAHCE
ncbi:LysR family transcriptional regulator (plasmid) [Sinorhizobium meliloti]|nr:LysR family transcriptional regulator [Sinorhizobium meliloti]